MAVRSQAGHPCSHECGQDAAEYAFLLALIAVVVAAGMTMLGCEIEDLFSQGVLTCWQGLGVIRWP